MNYNCSESRFIALNIYANLKGYSDVKHGSLQTGSKEHPQNETACKHMFQQSFPIIPSETGFTICRNNVRKACSGTSFPK